MMALFQKFVLGVIHCKKAKQSQRLQMARLRCSLLQDNEAQPDCFKIKEGYIQMYNSNFLSSKFVGLKYFRYFHRKSTRFGS